MEKEGFGTTELLKLLKDNFDLTVPDNFDHSRILIPLFDTIAHLFFDEIKKKKDGISDYIDVPGENKWHLIVIDGKAITIKIYTDVATAGKVYLYLISSLLFSSNEREPLQKILEMLRSFIATYTLAELKELSYNSKNLKKYQGNQNSHLPKEIHKFYKELHEFYVT